MIIEDETPLHDELSFLLRNAGNEMLAVKDCTNVAEQMKATDVDLNLLVINLPHANGETLLQDYRKQFNTP